MNTISTGVYRENRARFPLSELRKRNGQWVAFSADGLRLVASAPTLAELALQVGAVHENMRDMVLERIEIESMEINLGAAELL